MTIQQFVKVKVAALEKLCRSEGIALTVQRRVILEAVACRSDHPTADQIYDDIKKTIGSVSRTTVYRVLETLVQVGVVTRISNPQAKTRFDADVTRHHHFICLRCDSITDCRDHRAEDLVVPEAPPGFVVHGISLSITGICVACRSGGHDCS